MQLASCEEVSGRYRYPPSGTRRYLGSTFNLCLTARCVQTVPCCCFSASVYNATYESKIHTLLFELMMIQLGADIDREIIVLVDPVYPTPKSAFPPVYQNGTMLGER